jgi:hypothetical protein
VVLIGASNLTKCIATVLDCAHHAWGGPLEVLTAFGHGRSYGQASRIFGRQLPGILQCELWTSLALSPERPTTALVTDIGNDILYEQPVDRIVEWVEACLDRLAAARAETVVTLLPVENLGHISRVRFTLMRSMLVPRCRLNLATMTERAIAVNEAVRRLAEERRFIVVPQRREWYGFDPIHIRFSQRRPAWNEILGGWSNSWQARPRLAASLVRTAAVRLSVPHERRLWGLVQRRVQPALRFGDGTTVAMY